MKRLYWRIGLAVTVLAVLALVIPSLDQSARFQPPQEASAEHVIVVGVPGLRWEDVSTEHTPTLARLVTKGSAGSLSARSAPSVTCPGEGWLTVGAGTYAAQLDPDDIDPEAGCDPRQPPAIEHSGQGAVIPSMIELRKLNEELRFGAEIGSLGNMVSCTAAVGAGSVAAIADQNGYVDYYAEQLPAKPADFLTQCPLTAIEGGAINEQSDRIPALEAMDQRLHIIDRFRPANSVLLVAGLSETQANQPRLHVVVAEGGPYTPGWLHSPSTRRTPYVQLSDIAPTVLELLGHEIPSTMAGRPLIGGEKGRPVNLSEITHRLADTDVRAVAQRSVVGWFFSILAVIIFIALGIVIWLLVRRGRGLWVPDKALSVAGWVALTLAAVPVATFLANLVPWWRNSWPLLSVFISVIIAATVVVLVAAVVGAINPVGNPIRTRIIVLSGVTLLVFFIDGVTGSWLQLDSLLGYNPLVAGRFVGFGNIAFSIFSAAVVLFVTFIAYGQRPVPVLIIVTLVAVPTIAIDGLPQWGADFGGVLALVPAFVVLGLLTARLQVTWARVAGAMACGAILVLALGWLDHLRPPQQRSHFGRFVDSLIDGSAMQTIQRKLLTSLDLLFMGPHTIAGFALVTLLIVTIFRPPKTLRNAYEAMPVIRVALLAEVAMALLGFATNDSGIAIPLVMSLMIGPIILALCAWLALLPRKFDSLAGSSTRDLANTMMQQPVSSG